MVWTHDDTQNTNKNNLSTIDSNKIEKYSKFSQRHLNSFNSKTFIRTERKIVYNNSTNSLDNLTTITSNKSLNNISIQKDNASSLKDFKSNVEVHTIQADIHNEDLNCNSKYDFKLSSASKSSSEEEENVIVLNEVIRENSNCDNCVNELDMKCKFKGHAKNKVNMLVHRHTL